MGRRWPSGSWANRLASRTRSRSRLPLPKRSRPRTIAASSTEISSPRTSDYARRRRQAARLRIGEGCDLSRRHQIDAAGASHKVLAQPVVFFLGVSPDGRWLVARREVAGGHDSSQENVAFSTSGQPPVRLCATACEVGWTADAKSLVVRLGGDGSHAVARTFVVALGSAGTLPQWPPLGIRSQADLSGFHVSQVVDGSAYPEGTTGLVAFVRRTTQRNIYRVPLA